MKASDVTFDDMLAKRKANDMLAQATSFIQVEYGLEELLAHWTGFVDVSDDNEVTFTTKTRVCNEFATALSEYIEYSEPVSL